MLKSIPYPRTRFTGCAALRRVVAALGVALLALSFPTAGWSRNFIIFVVDGLRPGSVNPTDAPTLYSIRTNGVFFQNSHSLFPTFTTPNASAIATGHYLGDTGDFSNTIYSGYPVTVSGFTQTPFVENDAILGDIDEHFGGSFFDEETLLAYARTHGYNTAAVGKLGPVLIQDVTQGLPVNGVVPPPDTIILDDATGRTGGVPLRAEVAAALTAAGLPTTSPDRTNGQPSTSQGSNGFSGNNVTPGTLTPNVVQQQFFTDAITRVVLPGFRQNGKPFGLVYWSRDADGSQHNQGDSLNSLTPGINGPTSRASVKNADNNIAQILAYLNSVPGLAADTDIFVTADHGFSTISRHDLDATGAHFTTSYAASKTYRDATGRQEVNTGFLPPGFVAIDLAHFLNLPLFDNDATIIDPATGVRSYLPVDPTIPQATATVAQRPRNGDGLIGGTGAILTPTDAQVVVAANGGSDLIYLPVKNQALLERVVDFLSRQDYVSGLFVDPIYGSIPGALSLTDINLKGSALLPTPAIAVNFRSFTTNPGDPVNNGVSLCDTGLQEGQGMHGNFSRADTYNNMAAIGPDFKTGYADPTPVSNADVALTLANVLGFELPSNGQLTGRVIVEALASGPASVPFRRGIAESEVNAAGAKTSLLYQEVGPTRYFTVAGFPGAAVGLSALSVADVTQSEGGAGETDLTFTVTLSAPSADTVKVKYASADGTAKADRDYQPVSGKVIFAPGQTTQTFTVAALGNATPTPNRTFYVNLYQPTGAAIARAQAVGTIVNDDPFVLTGSAVEFTGRAGQDASGNVATFETTDSAPKLADFSALIKWGDGTSTPGTVLAFGTGAFVVRGEHTYANPGSYKVRAKIAGPNGANVKVVSGANVTAP